MQTNPTISVNKSKDFVNVVNNVTTMVTEIDKKRTLLMTLLNCGNIKR